MTIYPNGNPKAAAAKGKAQYHAIPTPALRECGGAMQQGEEKYGLVNWRVEGQEVSASTYVDALMRHLHKWMEGEQCSDDTRHIFPEGVHHLGHVMACCAILIDAERGGHMIDDRPSAARGKRPGEVKASRTEPRRSGPAVSHVNWKSCECAACWTRRDVEGMPQPSLTEAVKRAAKPRKRRGALGATPGP